VCGTVRVLYARGQRDDAEIDDRRRDRQRGPHEHAGACKVPQGRCTGVALPVSRPLARTRSRVLLQRIRIRCRSLLRTWPAASRGRGRGARARGTSSAPLGFALFLLLQARARNSRAPTTLPHAPNSVWSACQGERLRLRTDRRVSTTFFTYQQHSSQRLGPSCSPGTRAARQGASRGR
jgi:hypothetical protein